MVCIDNIVKTVTVNALPTATFYSPLMLALITNIALNNASSLHLPDNIATYAWTFGAGASPATSSAVQNPPNYLTVVV